MHEWRADMEHCYMTGNRHTRAHRGRERRRGSFYFQLANNTTRSNDHRQCKNTEENEPMTGYTRGKHGTKDIMRKTPDSSFVI